MTCRRLFVAAPLFALLLSGLVPAQVDAQVTAPSPLPLKYAGPPTTAAITAVDLMTRLYAFADDSMLGRAIGTTAHLRATDYLEREVRRLGLLPAGDAGSYFQQLPIFARTFDVTSTITIGDAVFKGGVDFLAASSGSVIGKPRQFLNSPAVFGGVVFDTTAILSVEQVRGKVLVLHTGPPPTGSQQAFINSNGYRTWLAMLGAASAVMTIDGDQIPASALRSATTPNGIIWRSDSTTTVSFGITTRLAEAIFQQPYGGIQKGAFGRIVSSDVRFTDVPRPGRNVVALLPGSDPKLKGEFVVIGAPSDHLAPFAARDHDSLRIYNRIVRPQGAVSPIIRPSEAQWKEITAALESVRRLRPARADSIYNGADDGGSGAVAALEIAEALAKGPAKPKRSVLFIWHAGEESGLRGAGHFVRHPTVPLDSIVAEINLNALGRGAATDQTGMTQTGAPVHGGDRYVQVIGSTRQSTEFGDLIPAANTDAKLGMDLDYTLDAPNNPLAILCRSDQAEYARFGIPVVYLTTGGNVDFHQVTDEPQYIQYDHFAGVTRLAQAVALRVANLKDRPVLDRPKPDISAPCRQ